MKRTLTSLMMTALFASSAMNAVAQSANTTNAATNYADTQWEHYAADNYAGGTGTADDPYLIATPEQFMKLAVEVENLGAVDDNWDADYSKGKYFKQTADLVFNQDVLKKVSYADGDASIIDKTNLRTFNGIGYKASDADFQRFAGNYDGGGHAIIGMYHSSGKSASSGVFNFTEGATIKNLIVKDVYISENANIGLVAGTADKNTLVINCQTSGIIYCGGSYHAGIVGALSTSKVVNCCSDAQIWAKNQAGGICGRLMQNAYAANNYFNGWIGATYYNYTTGKFKYWGAVAAEIGNSETTITLPDPADDTKTITTCENPSKAENCFWTDTCSVRHMNILAEAVNDLNNCKYGKIENCKAFAVADAAKAVEELNKNAKDIDGASTWEVGANGMPALKFDATTGINTVKTAADTTAAGNVYTLEGVLVKKAIDGVNPLFGLGKGVYIVNGKKCVVE